MASALSRYLEAANGLTNVTKSRAEQIVRQVVKQGEAAADQASDMVEELLDRSKQNREALVALVRAETQRAIGRMGIASRSEVERLEKQVSQLKRELAAATSGKGGSAAAGKTSATKKKASGTKATTGPTPKKTAKKTAKKTTKKATGATAKKSASAKKSPSTKSASKKKSS